MKGKTFAHVNKLSPIAEDKHHPNYAKSFFVLMFYHFLQPEFARSHQQQIPTFIQRYC